MYTQYATQPTHYMTPQGMILQGTQVTAAAQAAAHQQAAAAAAQQQAAVAQQQALIDYTAATGGYVTQLQAPTAYATDVAAQNGELKEVLLYYFTVKSLLKIVV